MRTKNCRRRGSGRSKVWIIAEVLNYFTVLFVAHLVGVLNVSFVLVTTVWMGGKYAYCYIIEEIMKVKHNTGDRR